MLRYSGLECIVESHSPALGEIVGCTRERAADLATTSACLPMRLALTYSARRYIISHPLPLVETSHPWTSDRRPGISVQMTLASSSTTTVKQDVSWRPAESSCPESPQGVEAGVDASNGGVALFDVPDMTVERDVAWRPAESREVPAAGRGGCPSRGGHPSGSSSLVMSEVTVEQDVTYMPAESCCPDSPEGEDAEVDASNVGVAIDVTRGQSV